MRKEVRMFRSSSTSAIVGIDLALAAIDGNRGCTRLSSRTLWQQRGGMCGASIPQCNNYPDGARK
jgi:hypothetical protein